MNQEVVQMEKIVRCKKHPQRPVSFIYSKQNCPYASWLACNKCVVEYGTFEGFVDILDVLQDPITMLSKKDKPYGIFDLLNDYFDLLKQDPEELIHFFKEDILKQIQKLEQDLKEGIAKYKQFRAEVAMAKEQFIEALGHAQFKQAFKDILQVNEYHQSEQWGQFEEVVKNFAIQFETQQNQELNEAFYKIKQKEDNFFQPQLLNDFQIRASKSAELLSHQLGELGLFKKFTSLCDTLYFYDLINRVQNKKNAKPNITLIFKGSEEGMNSQAFWRKCSDKGPTLIICQSKAGHVFGGYTPCIWNPNAAWQSDDSQKSFLFSYTRKEIYPVTTGEHAIFSRSDYGPTFGGQHNLYIASDFQNGYSNLNGQYYSNEQYKIENQKTHLMGSEKPELVEMEVFHIE